MPDDRKPRRHRDFAYPRPKSSPGVPVEIDPEATPPPRVPPAPEAFNTLPPAAQIRELHHIATEQAAAIDRVWDARHVVDRLKRLEIAETENTRQVTGLIVEVKQWADMSKKAFDKALAVSDNQIATNTRLTTFFDEQFPDFLSEIKAFNVTLGSVSARVSSVEADIERLTVEQTEQAVVIIDLKGRVSKIEDDGREKQIAASAVVAERKRWFQFLKLGHAVAVAVGGGIVALVHYLAN